MDKEGLEDHGEWLNFRMPHKGGVAVVRISREAMEDHFGVEQGDNLVQVFMVCGDAVEEAVRGKLQDGVKYTRDAPLVVRTADL